MTNEQVKSAFRRQLKGRSKNMSTDGTSLWSYMWWEIARWVDGEIIVRNGTSYSMTTASKHRPGVVGTKATLQTEAYKGVMEL